MSKVEQIAATFVFVLEVHVKSACLERDVEVEKSPASFEDEGGFGESGSLTP